MEKVQHNTEDLRSALSDSHPKVDTEHATGYEIMQYESSFEISPLLTRVNFEASVAVTMKDTVFWNIKQCILVQRGAMVPHFWETFTGDRHKNVGR